MESKVRRVDVLVAGGGMAGVFAALGARTPDVSVRIVEPQNVLGGQGTAGGVAGFCGDTRRCNGPFAELIAHLEEHGCIEAYEPNRDRLAYDREQMAFWLQERVMSAGIGVLFHSLVCGASAEEGRVRSVLVAAGGGLIEYEPRFVIDATGECVVAAAAGFQTMHEEARRQLPMSLLFTLRDAGRPVPPFLPPGCPVWERDDDLPMTTISRSPSGEVEVKMKLIGFDAADAESLSQAEIQGRRQMMGLLYHLQTKGYGGRRYGSYVLSSVASHIGVREGRRIVGEHVLTEQEVRSGCVFEDAVAVGTYHLDYHWPDRMERAGTGVTVMVEPYHIPLRSLIPKGAQNVLVPGRGASGDQMAMSSFRVMATCAQMGCAAGVAAAECIAKGCSLREVPISSVQRRLDAAGQALDLSQYGEYLRGSRRIQERVCAEPPPFSACHASTVEQLRNNQYLVAWFGGTREGHRDVAIWSARRTAGRWSAPQVVAKVRESPHWNPVLFRAPDGRVHLFFKVGDTIDAWETWVITSDDEGGRWSDPRELVPGDRGGRGPVKNKILVLSDGTWLAPASLERDGRWDAFVDRSADGGQSWTSSALVPLDHDMFPGNGIIQPTLWETSPGHVHMLLRSTCGRVCRSDSQDAGRTWSPAQQTALPNNNSGLDVARLHDGVLALALNPVGENRGPRTPLSILLSLDDGENWPHRMDIETGPGEYSYPSIIPTAVGFAVSYTWRRSNIGFRVCSMEEVIGPPAVGR